MKSIGIEICENAEGNFEQAVENAQWLIRKLMGDFGIPLSNVVPHKHWSGKDCPRKLLGRWEQFKAGIAIAHTGSKSTRKPVQAESLSHKAPVSKQKSSKLSSSILKVTKPLTKGPQVTAVQKALSSLYFYPEKGAKNNGIDGYYGPKTANAVKRFQLMNGLVADGIYGPKTKNRIEQLQNK